MANVHISFLGGTAYNMVSYTFGGVVASPTLYAQAAEVQVLGAHTFDRVVVLATEGAESQHGDPFRAALADVGLPAHVPVEFVRIPDGGIAVSDHWAWFDALLSSVEDGDSVVFDLTYGFRAMPIVASGALGYLRRARDIHVRAVLVGVLASVPPTLTDLTHFYVIQDWADAVNRLVHDANASGLAKLAEEGGTAFPGLRDPSVIDALRRLTEVLVNVEVQKVSEVADEALGTLQRQLAAGTSPSERQLLQMVVSKFARLSVRPPTTRYDLDYLRIQVAVARMLIQHGMLMQGYTVLRELVGSIGMYGIGRGAWGMRSSAERGNRRYAEVFVSMLGYDATTSTGARGWREGWRFDGDSRKQAEKLLPWFDALAEAGEVLCLRQVLQDVRTHRNGFDHAWTSHNGDINVTKLRDEGLRHADTLDALIERLPSVALPAPTP